MAPEVVVALITGAAAFTVSLASFPLNYLISQRARRVQTQDLMGRYRDPLLWAIHDLRSRIRTILDEDFLGRYLGQRRFSTRSFRSRPAYSGRWMSS